MKKPPNIPLRACDVLNWDYLVEIGEKPEGEIRNVFVRALREFAYDFTSTKDEDVRDQLLRDVLKRGTDHVSRESAEELLKTIATHLHSDRNALRKFAKENGVRLTLDWWLARRDPTFSYP